MSRTQPVRLLHLVSHPIQYFAPLYRELATRPELDLTVCFYSVASLGEYYDEGFRRPVRWDTDLLDGYRSRVLPPARTRPVAPASAYPSWEIAAEARSPEYDAVWTHGYAHATTWLAQTHARVVRKPLLVRDEQTLLPERSVLRRALKYPALRAFFAGVTGLYIGQENRRYLRHYGVPEDRLFPARYCVDNRFFRARADKLAGRRPQLRAHFGIEDDAPVVLFVGKLEPVKRPLLLLDAFARARASRPCWLLVVGDGPLRGEAEAYVARNALENVRFAGFLNQREVPLAYTAADLLVLCSMAETWGLVVNEGMNFGLPVVATDRVGCAADLVRPGWNGFVANDGARQLADAIARLVADSGLRDRFSERSRALVNRYSVEACADGIVEACLRAVRGGAPTREAVAA